MKSVLRSSLKQVVSMYCRDITLELLDIVLELAVLSPTLVQELSVFNCKDPNSKYE